MRLPRPTLLQRIFATADRFGWIGPLLARLSLAAVFIPTGWGKLHNLGQITAYFTELHVPMPHLNAVVASTTEFVGGSLILVGLLTRVASLPLAVVMVVAILTAKRADIDGPTALFAFNEATYFAVFVWLALKGAGAASFDALLHRRMPKPLRPLLRPAPETQSS